jgi:hypothetical protein
MNIRWIGAVTVLGCCTFAAWLLTSYFHELTVYSPLLLVLAVVALIWSRRYLASGPSSRRVTFVIGRWLSPWLRWMTVLGVLLLLAAPFWLVLALHSVANTNTGALIVFMPAIAMLIAGTLLVFTRLFVWFAGRRE